MKQVDLLKKQLKPGEVYRRADLEQWSTAVDRHLQQLVHDGTLEKLSGGLYYVPRQSVFGKTPADEKALIHTFLKDDRFVVTSPSDYNTLGVGTTQLYNERRVYNHKRHGTFKLGNRSFRFVRRPYVPEKLSKEFLLVDLVNNLNKLEEDQPALFDNVKRKAKEMDRKKLARLVHDFGTVGTKKKFADLLKD
ncbi:MAG: hypothetical protein P0Y53_13800 [Candidatus Pseudobacter hemicellulosilyticus]|uniref:Transcriptional regulator, AbiEi antitoxin, Type IV TA system n=1 Tax=Candidatus Pseudobacter hemicellulosilyticus TaxID=3121375 RepID=A0AAJ6BFZ3_9BACT|nr:MAG: hypothetical protein P0Y53_13800 [Pseudobacter sp.]